jgi:Pyruvate/2-oxoacid:ferredoxin oxidoreductase delta subunit
MGQSIVFAGAIVSLSDVDFKCPNCQEKYGPDFYEKQLQESTKGLIYKKCKGCKEKIGITTDIRGDVRVWMKKEEQKHG